MSSPVGLKLLVIGDVNVGKSAVVRRYVQGEYSACYKATIGVEFALAKRLIGGKEVDLCFWDIAGQERVANLTRAYYQGGLGAIIVFDITRRKTWEQAQVWLKDLRAKVSFPESDKPLPVVLMANKCDLSKIPEGADGSITGCPLTSVKDSVDVDGALGVHQMPEDSVIEECIRADGSITGWHLTSAKDNVGIDGAIEELVQKIWQLLQVAPPPASSPVIPPVVLSSSSSQPRASGCAC